MKKKEDRCVRSCLLSVRRQSHVHIYYMDLYFWPLNLGFKNWYLLLVYSRKVLYSYQMLLNSDTVGLTVLYFH